MSELKFDPKNYRIHDEKNKRLIRKSLEDCGAGRSILFDKDNCIIAGNGVYEAAQKLGLPVRIIESDGTELIAIKRTDLATEDAKRKALALADNHTSDTSVFDVEAVLEDFTAEELDLWEFSIGDIGELNTEDESKNDNDPYTKKVSSPIYTPTGDKPKTGELFDVQKYNELVAEIKRAPIDDTEKEFLLFAATRHIVFDYSKIAEYYAHSSKETQELMENSALVIIDFDKAIELGYVKLKQDIAEQYKEDYEDEEE